MVKTKEIMNTKEVSEFLKLHPFTVNKLAREGKIPAFKIGADWRFHKKHIERWISEKIAFSQQGRERRKPGRPGEPESTLI
jgi:excisionase family DNA binding protein